MAQTVTEQTRGESRYASRCTGPVLRGVSLEVAKHFGKVSRIFVHPQHPRTVLVDETNTSSPEALAAVTSGITSRQARCGVGVDEEWFERVTDLIAHVRVRQIQASQYNRLQLLLTRYLSNALHTHTHTLAIKRAFLIFNAQTTSFQF